MGYVSTASNSHTGKTYTVSTVQMGRIGESRVIEGGRFKAIMGGGSALGLRYLERELTDSASLEDLHARVVRLAALDDPAEWTMSIDQLLVLKDLENPDPTNSISRMADEFRRTEVASDEEEEEEEEGTEASDEVDHNDSDKRDRLAADRLRALGRHDLISADGTLWWNSPNWEPIGFSLNYQISSAEEMQRPGHDHGIVDFISHLPSKEELRRAKELPPQDPEEIKRHLDELNQAAERVRQERERLAQKPAPTLQDAERQIVAEREQRMARTHKPTPMPETPERIGSEPVVPKQLSRDGDWWWNGSQWRPTSELSPAFRQQFDTPESREIFNSADPDLQQVFFKSAPAVQKEVESFRHSMPLIKAAFELAWAQFIRSHASTDGKWWWDGSQWLPTANVRFEQVQEKFESEWGDYAQRLSSDGKSWWDGSQWVPLIQS